MDSATLQPVGVERHALAETNWPMSIDASAESVDGLSISDEGAFKSKSPPACASGVKNRARQGILGARAPGYDLRPRASVWLIVHRGPHTMSS